MCGIVGYIGKQQAQPILLEGLSKLEYRGYDSAGISVLTAGGLDIAKSQGRLANLTDKVENEPLKGSSGIGHTRWATHGKPSDQNSHPHLDNSAKFAVVHNGIVENYMQLKEQLMKKGYTFVSETDSEVIAHLIADEYKGDLVEAVSRAASHMQGAYALGVLSELEPDKLIAVRNASPLIVGIGEDESFISSDIPAILNHTRNIYILDDGEMAVLTPQGAQFMTIKGEAIPKEVQFIDWDITTAEKAGYDHFMLKEIHEQPRAYRNTMLGRMNKLQQVELQDLGMTSDLLQQIDRVHIVACGTAYHAGLVGKYAIEALVRIPVEIDVASEYRYRSPIITPKTLVIVVSQSGETADTLAALREAKGQGASVLAITNVVGSSIAREADFVFTTGAGPEIAVASTKAYTTQLIAFYLISMYIAEVRQVMDADKCHSLLRDLQQLPEQAEYILENTAKLEQLAKSLSSQKDLFFIGRGLDYAVAQEGSLKLKEISYLHSEAYAAGELKHGTLALIDEGTPVIALITQEALLEKTISNIKEVKARGAYVVAIVSEPMLEQVTQTVDELYTIPQTEALLSPALSVIPLQLLSYYVAVDLGRDVDKPRNLAKSVTVE